MTVEVGFCFDELLVFKPYFVVVYIEVIFMDPSIKLLIEDHLVNIVELFVFFLTLSIWQGRPNFAEIDDVDCLSKSTLQLHSIVWLFG